MDGLCSLREAVNSANDNALTNASGCNAAGTSAAADQIAVPAGTYTLSTAGSDDSNAGGDLDLTGTLTITGAGAATTIIKGVGRPGDRRTTQRQRIGRRRDHPRRRDAQRRRRGHADDGRRYRSERWGHPQRR